MFDFGGNNKYKGFTLAMRVNALCAEIKPEEEEEKEEFSKEDIADA